MKWAILVTLFVVFGAPEAAAQPKTLRWTRLAVAAHLDSNGRLHVEERQSIVFNGDWNGAERDFPVSLDHEFNLDRISRIDESGAVVPLRKSDSLSDVDEFALFGSLLRWRSRLPSDPPFRNREITYVLAYKYGRILIPGDGSYLLDHNFGLPNLQWPIDQFALDLSLDPVWQAVDPVPSHVTRSHVQGQNVTVTARLRYTGATLPSAVNHGAPPWIRYALLALLLAGTAGLGRQFWRRERALGRFAPLTDPASIDRPWLEEHVFSFPAEVVGAAWDDRTGTAEVAALIARLVHEKKLGSRVEKDELVLTLLRPKDSFKGYEGALVKSLFIAGDTTSTSQIKKHYKSRGFDPVEKIRKPIEILIGQTAGSKGAPKIERKWTAIGGVAGVILLAGGGFDGALNLGWAFRESAVVVLFYLAGLGGAINYRRQLSSLDLRALQFLPAVLLILMVPAARLLQANGVRLNSLVLAGLCLLSLALIRSLFNLAKSRDAGERLEHRRRLAAGRNYFIRELRQSNPALDDAWFPYVLAFGLAKDADRWFRSFGGTDTSSPSSRTTFDSSRGDSWSSGGSRASSGGWSGFGGGASGGAGASGAWAVAATSMASGVSSPSSSSSSSGGSSGGGSSSGGSSGGGGGGGW
jgi:uncharacterized membrane protein YgcG